jgi:hypothetical protein
MPEGSGGLNVGELAWSSRLQYPGSLVSRACEADKLEPTLMFWQYPTPAPTDYPTASPTEEPTAVSMGPSIPTACCISTTSYMSETSAADPYSGVQKVFQFLSLNLFSSLPGPLSGPHGGAHGLPDQLSHTLPHRRAHGRAHGQPHGGSHCRTSITLCDTAHSEQDPAASAEVAHWTVAPRDLNGRFGCSAPCEWPKLTDVLGLGSTRPRARPRIPRPSPHPRPPR